MITLIKIIYESIVQAYQQLVSNKMRSFLSLLGISIGIFCIIGVLSAVDSLEENVMGSVEQLGDDVVFVEKFKWDATPENFQKYMRRPNIDHKDFEKVEKRVKSASLNAYSVYLGNKTIKYKSNNVERVPLIGITYDFSEMFNMEYGLGRYYSPSEYYFGSNKIILGHTIAEKLFGALNPMGKIIKLGGRKLEVIGVFEKKGESLINVMNFDELIVISYELARKIANLNNNSPYGNTSIYSKAEEGASIDQLKDEITGVLRAHRRLKPKQEDNFSLNTLSILSNLLGSFFSVLNMLGFFIGAFAILVGMFSVANIMFVSVKERTGIIGVKKALGAKRYMILLEFLIEAVILCIIGGLLGLVLIKITVVILSGAIDFELFLSLKNVLFGLLLSVGIGVLSGFIPAFRGASMDPVEAMRK
ncbi:MAG: FtsX-like permease family protein [Bacteroidetes bacterium]|nr:FtsX-like permease family protein [Bacteroidota bacterium]